MNCPNCSTPNADDSRFCENCGKPLAARCPTCGEPVKAGARFCRNCGHDLSGGAGTAARLAALQQEAPGALQSKIRSAGTQAAGERKQVTVLFTDIVGSTALAEKLDPEEWGEIVSGAHQRVSAAVYRYEGTIAQLLGDGVLAFFGAPVAHEDDPERAVNASLEIQARISEYAGELRQRKRVDDFQMRVGLNTGLVVVGNVGSDLHVEYLAIGDTVNLAARMQSAAEPGTVLLSANTARAVQHAFELESRGRIEVKGKSEPVAVSRVLKRKAEASSPRGIAGLDSPLVGRDAPLQALRARIDQLAEGRGSIVAVMGEAGLGKSRLVAELRKAVLGKYDGSIEWIEGRSLSYETTTPYAPFVDLFVRYFGFQAGEADRDRYDKIGARLQAMDRAAEIGPFVATLLGVSLPHPESERVRYLEPPQLRERIFSAVHLFFEELAARRRVVLVFEDLHWVDPTSLALIERLMDLARDKALLMLALFRPQRQESSWRYHETALRDYADRYAEIALEPLTEAESRALVGHLLHVEDLPEKVRALILKKAEGNPFFVEEVIRSLLDAGWVVREDGHWRATRGIEHIGIPDTLAGVIHARLDRLDDGAKRAAQTAAVIGREFQFPLLEEISEARSELDRAVQSLEERELVREKARVPELTYLFKHALTQEAAYGSVLMSKRRELHKRVGECLEKNAPDRVADLARHFVEGQEWMRALPYLIQAGQRAVREYSTEEAIGYFGRAVEILANLPATPSARPAFEGLGGALTLVGDMPRTLQNYQAMLAYGEKIPDIPMQVSAHNKLAFVQMYVGDFENVEKNLVQAEQLARGAQDKAGLVEMFTIRCGICTASGDFDTAVKYLGESVQVGREMNVKEQMAYGLTHTANTLIFMTRYDEAWEKAQEAMRVCREAGDRQHEAELQAFLMPVLYLRNGDVVAAQREAERGVALAARIGAAFAGTMGNWALGTIARLRGEYESAVAFFQQSLDSARTSPPLFLVMPLASLGATWLEVSPALAAKSADLHAQALKIMENPMGASMGGIGWADVGWGALILNDLELAAELFQKGLNYPTTQRLMYKHHNLLGMAYVALRQKRLDDAAKFVAEARAYAEERAIRYVLPEIELADARVCAARGDGERAAELFARAEELAQPMRLRPVIWRARAGRANALRDLGRAEEADAQRQSAQAAIDEVAGLFKDGQTRAVFLESAKGALA